jgi:hypothetical protein
MFTIRKPGFSGAKKPLRITHIALVIKSLLEIDCFLFIPKLPYWDTVSRIVASIIENDTWKSKFLLKRATLFQDLI